MKPTSLFRRLRILPVLIVVASLAFVVRLGDAYVSMKSLSGSAYAEDKPTEKAPEKAPDAGTEAAATQPPADTLKSKDDPAVKDAGAADVTLPSTTDAAAADKTAADKAADDKTSSDKKWQDAADTDSDESDIKTDMYKDLAKRRAELDEKDKKLGEREALLEAAQKELDRKMKEMEGLRDQIKDLLKQQTAEEAARIQSLVKIYSGMKPKDAARIFDTLDTDILMDVISNMPEAKASPIMALMDAERAKALTTLLAEQKKLPDMP